MDQLQLFQSEHCEPLYRYWRSQVRDCVRAIYRGRHDLEGHDWNWGSHSVETFARFLFDHGRMEQAEYQRLAHLEQRCRRWESARTTNLETISNSLA